MKKKIELKPSPKCKDCLGKGIIRIIRPDLDATKYRELRPCHCVKAVVKVEELDYKDSEHRAVL